MRSRRTKILAMVGLLTASAWGCTSNPLTDPNLPRSQYDRYWQLRGQPRSDALLNPFAAEQPALRERLAPLEREF